MGKLGRIGCSGGGTLLLQRVRSERHPTEYIYKGFVVNHIYLQVSFSILFPSILDLFISLLLSRNFIHSAIFLTFFWLNLDSCLELPGASILK